MLTQKLMDHPSPSLSLKIHIFLDKKYLYSTWLADSFSFLAVDYRTHFSIFNFLAYGKFCVRCI